MIHTIESNNPDADTLFLMECPRCMMMRNFPTLETEGPCERCLAGLVVYGTIVDLPFAVKGRRFTGDVVDVTWITSSGFVSRIVVKAVEFPTLFARLPNVEKK